MSILNREINLIAWLGVFFSPYMLFYIYFSLYGINLTEKVQKASTTRFAKKDKS